MKKFICVFLSLVLMISVCACDFVQPMKTEATPEVNVGSNVVNPAADATVESIMTEVGIDMSAAAAYENAAFAIINGEPKLAQAQFTLDGDNYCYRAAPVASETSIDGMYYTWTSTQSAEVGYCTAAVSLTAEGQGVISWFDAAPGIMYSVSMSENATAEKLISIANALFSPTQGEADGDFAVVFADLFYQMQQSFHRATAGSSLVGLSYAAQFADTLTKYAPTAEDVIAVVEQTAADLDSDSRALLYQQMDGIVSNYQYLVSDGTSSLADTGYTAVSYPWDDSAIAPLFDAMLKTAGGYVYDGVLSSYYTAISENWGWEDIDLAGMNPLITLCGEPKSDVVGYQIVDLDDDGTVELLIGTITPDDEFLGKMILVVYSLDELDEPVVVFSGGERDRLYYAGGDLFSNVGSGSAFDSFDSTFRYENGNLTDTGVVTPAENYVQAELTAFSKLG